MLHFSRWKTAFIWFVLLLAVAFAAPNLFSREQLAALPSWMPHKKVVLGLDLQGGSQIMLKIEREDIVRERLESAVGEVRTRLRDGGIRYSGLIGNDRTIQVRITDPAQVDAATTALAPLTQVISTGTLGRVAPDATLTPGADGQLTLQLTDAGIDYRASEALSQSIDVVRRRVAELGNADPVIQRQGADRLIVQVPGLVDAQRLKTLLNQTAKLSFHLVDNSMSVQEAIDGRPPADTEVLYSQDDPPVAYLVSKQAVVSSRDIIDAEAGLNQKNRQSVVTFRLDAEATERFAQATQKNIGRTFAIVLDDQVISAPTIREAVTAGTGQISGNFSAEGADDLAVLMRAGALPATLTVVEERTVGPGLGSDSVHAGLIACAVGAVLVIALMWWLYGFLGLIADVALAANVILIIAILSAAGSTLTLPGIAGIVLTMGMAVDSNVLIYERIREEIKSGHPLGEAVEIGFSRALATIVDANVTTFIAACILFYLGTGPVRGFAVTLAIGILTTVFTAFMLTRWIVMRWIDQRKPRTLPKGVRTGIFDGTNIRFMGIRRYTFTASAIVSLCALIAFAGIGMHLGIDFNGGSVIEVKAKQGNADLADIRERLGQLNLGEIQAQTFGDRSSALIRVQSQGGGENAEQSAITLIREELQDQYEFRRVEVVGPSVSGELTRSATLGVLAALAATLLYIWLRFKWQFAIGAMIATLHDIILTLGFFVLTGMEFNLASIAAILTIVGYSLNDTVVIYDRMRENLRRYTKMPLPILIDASINQTLSRTVLTSVTTLVALIALYIFGGEIVRSFTSILIFGVVVGTFSSIYIAAPVLLLFRLRPEAFDRSGRKAFVKTEFRSEKPTV